MTSTAAPPVWVVDDDAAVRAAVASLLASAGFDAAMFSSAEDCLRDPRLESAAIVLIDIGLPGMNGLALQAALAARGLRPVVIIVSGQADAAVASAALQAGALAVLHKPLDGDELLRLIGQTLR